MKKHVKIIAILSITLLLCTLIGQLIWLIKIKSIKRNEFIKISNMSLSQCVHEYLETEMMNRSYGFYCALRKDGRTFAYDKNKSVQITNQIICSLSFIGMYCPVFFCCLFLLFCLRSDSQKSAQCN